MTASKAPKKIPWTAVTADEWSCGYRSVAATYGVTTMAARSAHKRILAGSGRLPGRAIKPVPDDLKTTDTPAQVVSRYGVSLPTARKWLAAAGREADAVGRPKLQPEGAE